EPFTPAELPESPFADNDGDGLLNWEEEQNGTDKNNPDTDGDGLSDFEEVKIHGTNPCLADMDCDMLTDFEELFVYYTAPDKKDTDGDNLSDGVEVMEMHTDPRKDDSDGDRLKDGYEVRFGMNPLSNDTDGDQWDDWNEFNYWYKCVQNESLSASYCSTPDVDGDSITDYQEVKGYNVRIITVWDENGTPVYSDREMHGDPLSAYKQPSGAWTDTDSDNIPDIVEIYFSNITNIDNNTM
ncbi:MAG: hypothetical protein ACP5LE_07710, partial [Thermoplasmata archaeon]